LLSREARKIRRKKHKRRELSAAPRVPSTLFVLASPRLRIWGLFREDGICDRLVRIGRFLRAHWPFAAPLPFVCDAKDLKQERIKSRNRGTSAVADCSGRGGGLRRSVSVVLHRDEVWLHIAIG
jgi:hypothetical protein